MPPNIERVCARCGYRTTQPIDQCPACALPLQAQERTWTEKRRAARVPLPPGVAGEVADSVPVSVLDLSPLGARIEHADPLPPGQPCRLTIFRPDAAPLRLPARVIWSKVAPVEPLPGQRRWVYRSGVEFWEAPPAVLRDLGHYLSRWGGKEQWPSPGAVDVRQE